jgi:hypothetical protein
VLAVFLRVDFEHFQYLLMVKIAVPTLKTLVCQLIDQSLVREYSSYRVLELLTKLNRGVAWQFVSLMYDDTESRFGFDIKVAAVPCCMESSS